VVLELDIFLSSFFIMDYVCEVADRDLEEIFHKFMGFISRMF
jgi:hypothetical protein